MLYCGGVLVGVMPGDDVFFVRSGSFENSSVGDNKEVIANFVNRQRCD
ncbi:MAG: hypothetical protein NZM38_03280 [Cytophagales bacterium]|nr:hypothetical protein [Cytophagales bacterium]MDW8383776.1 hypothetical protein [Flammeovirgaceae bacterium]